MTKECELPPPIDRRFGNGLTLSELAKIEEAAHRNITEESKTILRLAAALREEMQIEESAWALLSIRDLKKRKPTA